MRAGRRQAAPRETLSVITPPPLWLRYPLVDIPNWSSPYHWKDNKLVPHPEEAPVRKLIYELFAECQRKRTVARILNERSYRTRDGSKFSDTSVGRLIQDPTAEGIHRANYTRRVANNRRWALKPERDWVLNPGERIVSDELLSPCCPFEEPPGDYKPQKSGPRLTRGH